MVLRVVAIAGDLSQRDELIVRLAALEDCVIATAGVFGDDDLSGLDRTLHYGTNARDHRHALCRLRL